MNEKHLLYQWYFYSCLISGPRDLSFEVGFNWIYIPISKKYWGSTFSGFITIYYCEHSSTHSSHANWGHLSWGVVSFEYMSEYFGKHLEDTIMIIIQMTNRKEILK